MNLPKTDSENHPPITPGPQVPLDAKLFFAMCYLIKSRPTDAFPVIQSIFLSALASKDDELVSDDTMADTNESLLRDIVILYLRIHPNAAEVFQRIFQTALRNRDLILSAPSQEATLANLKYD